MEWRYGVLLGRAWVMYASLRREGRVKIMRVHHKSAYYGMEYVVYRWPGME